MKASWSDVDVIIRKCAEVVLQGHRWGRNGYKEEGLHGPMFFAVACIELRDRLNKVLDA